MRYKGKYVALVEIDFDIEKSEWMLPFEEIKKKTVDGGKERQGNRAKTFPGIAKAMAEQWG